MTPNGPEPELRVARPIAVCRPAPHLMNQVNELTRELACRDAVYPRLIAAGKLRADNATHRVVQLEDALATIRALELLSRQGAIQITISPAPSALPRVEQTACERAG